MKIFFLAISYWLTAISYNTQAQQSAQPAKHTTPAKKSAASPLYRCPVCGATSTKPGDCPKDKVSYVKIGDYYCPDCYMSSSKPGKCEMCGVPLVKMEAPAH